MSFSEVKARYPYVAAVTSKTSTNKIIICAAIGAGAGVILVTISYVITRIKRNRLRKAAAQREAARRNNYSTNANANEAPRSNQVAEQNNPDPRGINVDVVEQQNEWNDIYQQLYGNNNNPQAQGTAYSSNNYPQNHQMYYANNPQNQNQYPLQNAPAQQQQQQQQGHRVRVPNDS